MGMQVSRDSVCALTNEWFDNSMPALIYLEHRLQHTQLCTIYSSVHQEMKLSFS